MKRREDQRRAGVKESGQPKKEGQKLALAFDTSTPSSGVALVRGGVVLGLYTLHQERTRAEALLPTVQMLLESCHLTMRDVDVIGVAVGPGSFTGLRIGVTVAKTLAQLLDIDLVGVSTLRAMSSVSTYDSLIVPVIDARANRVFAAGYAYEDGALQCVVPEDLYYEADFVESVQALEKKDVLVVGEGRLRHAVIEETLATRPSSALYDMSPAVQIAQIALERAAAGALDSPLDLAPNYLRKSQAEMDYGRKHGQ